LFARGRYKAGYVLCAMQLRLLFSLKYFLPRNNVVNYWILR